jgi:tetratricopeptide (TPR) repeat protein
MNPSSLLWIVDLHLLAGDRDAAQRASTTWTARMSPAVRLAVEGRLHEASGDDAGATQAYRNALRSDPLMVGIAHRLNDLYQRSGQPFALEPFLLETAATNPKVDAYWDMAGQLAMSRGDHQEAILRFGKANALQPDDGRYLGHLASALAATGRLGEARDKLAWADRVPHSTADAWMALGSAWDRVGEPDRAVRAFEAAKSAGYLGPGADIGAVLALARAGRAADALRALAEAEARFPESQALAQLRGRLGP